MQIKHYKQQYNFGTWTMIVVEGGVIMRLVEAVGKRIEAILQERKLTLYRVAKDGGFPRQTIGEITQAKNKTVSLNAIYQITDTLGISLTEFFNNPLYEDVTD